MPNLDIFYVHLWCIWFMSVEYIIIPSKPHDVVIATLKLQPYIDIIWAQILYITRLGLHLEQERECP